MEKFSWVKIHFPRYTLSKFHHSSFSIFRPSYYLPLIFRLFFSLLPKFLPSGTWEHPGKFSTPGPSAVHFQNGGRSCKIYGTTFYKLICLTQVCCGSSVEEVSYTFKIQIWFAPPLLEALRESLSTEGSIQTPELLVLFLQRLVWRKTNCCSFEQRRKQAG